MYLYLIKYFGDVVAVRISDLKMKTPKCIGLCVQGLKKWVKMYTKFIKKYPSNHDLKTVQAIRPVRKKHGPSQPYFPMEDLATSALNIYNVLASVRT